MIKVKALIAKNNPSKYLLYFLVSSAALFSIFKDTKHLKNWYEKSQFGCIALIVFLGLLFIYFGFKLLDRRKN